MIHIHSRFEEIDDFALAGVDAAIGIRDNQPRALIAHTLQDEYPVPIASPALVETHLITTPQDLSKSLLLHVGRRPQAWAEWFAAQGLNPPNAHTGPQFELTAHLIQCVAAGIGVGLVPRVLVEDELQQGTLVVPILVKNHSRRCFCLTYPQHNATLPQLAVFKEWLLEEIALC
jgi:DNA-binding transcriptional LysR family regulator